MKKTRKNVSFFPIAFDGPERKNGHALHADDGLGSKNDLDSPLGDGDDDENDVCVHGRESENRYCCENVNERTLMSSWTMNCTVAVLCDDDALNPADSPSALVNESENHDGGDCVKKNGRDAADQLLEQCCCLGCRHQSTATPNRLSIVLGVNRKICPNTTL